MRPLEFSRGWLMFNLLATVSVPKRRSHVGNACDNCMTHVTVIRHQGTRGQGRPLRWLVRQGKQ